MRTSKPISTICYLDVDTLNQRLLRLFTVHKDKIAYTAFIKHNAESDNAKDHIHLLVVPCSMIDTDALWFKEVFDTLYNDQIVSSIKPWQSSKLDDALMYFSHNEQYLMRKGISRKYHYFESDFFVSDAEWFAEAYEIALSAYRSCAEKMLSCITQNLNVFQAMSVCGVSYGAMKSFCDTYNSMQNYFYEESKKNYYYKEN